MSKRFVERTKEPWFGHDSIFAYVHVLILKEALERAGVGRPRQGERGDPRAGHDRPARRCSSPAITCNTTRKGRRIGAKMVMVQWQNGRPVTVFPADVAVAEAKWKA